MLLFLQSTLNFSFIIITIHITVSKLPYSILKVFYVAVYKFQDTKINGFKESLNLLGDSLKR